jgi:hypothetical protein
MINNFHIQAQNHQNLKDDHNLLVILQIVVTTHYRTTYIYKTLVQG